MQKLAAYDRKSTPAASLKKAHLIEARCWAGMIQRCSNTKLADYKHYGGRGITVCARWKASFAAFLEDVGLRPSPGYSLDRIDNDGNYEPGNCQWATKQQQNSNRQDWKCGPRKPHKIGLLHPMVKELLTEINAYRRQTGIGRTLFGMRVMGDGHFIARLENGRQPRLATIERVRAYMARKNRRAA